MINPATNTVTATIPLDASYDLGGVAVSPTGPQAGDIYASGTVNPGAIDVINPATNTVTATIPDVGVYPGPTAVSPIGPEAGDIYVTDPIDGIVTVIPPS